MSDLLPQYENLSSPRMESAVLGGCTVSDRLARQAAMVLQETHFTSDRARAHWRCIICCIENGKHVGRVTLFEAAQALKLAETVTLGYLADVDNGMPVEIYGFDSWLASVDELRHRRRLAMALQQLDKRNCDLSEPFAEVLESARRIVSRIEGEACEADELMTAGRVVENAGGPDVFFGPERLQGVVPTPFVSVQHKFLGFQPEAYVLLAGRPSYGKSALAIQLALHAASLGHSVIFYSLEMSKESVVQRATALLTGIGLGNLIRGSLNRAERERVQRALQKMTDWPFRLAYTPRVTIPKIQSHLSRQAVKPGLVVVDYLQLISTSAKGNRNEAVSEVSRGLKLLAGEFRTCVLALSQLKRPERGDDRDGPQLWHLRDSGSLEQDADAVFFLHGAEAEKLKPRRNVEFLIAKQRNGELAKIPLIFDAQFQRFEEPAAGQGHESEEDWGEK